MFNAQSEKPMLERLALVGIWVKLAVYEFASGNRGSKQSAFRRKAIAKKSLLWVGCQSLLKKWKVGILLDLLQADHARGKPD